MKLHSAKAHAYVEANNKTPASNRKNERTAKMRAEMFIWYSYLQKQLSCPDGVIATTFKYDANGNLVFVNTSRTKKDGQTTPNMGVTGIVPNSRVIQNVLLK